MYVQFTFCFKEAGKHKNDEMMIDTIKNDKNRDYYY